MMRKYPIGMQTFGKIREEGFLYVDKTEIIHRLVETGAYYFLSRPRRFGKSLLLDTIRELFEGNKKLFEGLWIYDQWDWTKKNPVIHLKISQTNYQKIGLYNALNKELDQMAGYLNVSLVETDLKDKFRELIIKCAAERQVVILVDEYDKPLIDYLNDPAKVDENRGVFKQFYSVLKDADAYIRFLMLTGVSRFSKVSLFSDLNNLEDISIGRNFNSLVGITQAELETFFAPEIKEMESDDSNILETIKKWYNGYTWGGAETLYNPFSLLNLMKSREFQNFWFQTGTPSFFYDMIQRNPTLNFPDGEVEAGAEVLIDLFNQKTEYQGPDSIKPVTIMFQTGYLTIKSYNAQRRTYILDYPNLEVQESMQVFLLGAYTHQSTEAVRPTVLNIGDAFREDDLALVIRLIDTQFVNIPNTLWVGAGERFYHAIIHNTFGLLDIVMESERNYAGIRPDITVFTKTHIYVLEFKRDESAESALKQIIDKDYFRPFQTDKRKKVAVGINFSSEKKAISEYDVKEMPI